MANGTMSAPVSANPFAGVASSGGGGGDYKLIDPGNYPGHLIAIVDLGTHDDTYMGTAKPDQRNVCLAFELSGEAGFPVISEVFTVWVKDGLWQYGEKNAMRKLLEGWRGKAYAPNEPVDPMPVLGRSCMINVVHKETKKKTTIHKVGTVSALPKGMTAPARHYEPIAYHISMGHPPDLSHVPFVYAGTPKGMQAVADVIEQSKEKKGLPINDGSDTAYSEKAEPGLPEHVKPSAEDLPDF